MRWRIALSEAAAAAPPAAANAVPAAPASVAAGSSAAAIDVRLRGPPPPGFSAVRRDAVTGQLISPQPRAYGLLGKPRAPFPPPASGLRLGLTTQRSRPAGSRSISDRHPRNPPPPPPTVPPPSPPPPAPPSPVSADHSPTPLGWPRAPWGPRPQTDRPDVGAAVAAVVVKPTKAPPPGFDELAVPWPRLAGGPPGTVAAVLKAPPVKGPPVKAPPTSPPVEAVGLAPPRLAPAATGVVPPAVEAPPVKAAPVKAPPTSPPVEAVGLAPPRLARAAPGVVLPPVEAAREEPIPPAPERPPPPPPRPPMTSSAFYERHLMAGGREPRRAPAPGDGGISCTPPDLQVRPRAGVGR
jgi:hypothetical protein